MPERQLARIPGGELVQKGLRDLARGASTTQEALLVAIGAPRLRACGLTIPDLPAYERDPELLLYTSLRASSLNAYRDYNALLRRLVSCEHALERRAQASEFRPG